jgi:hypothetical protein
MKLSTKQIDLIDRYLEQRNLLFVDVKVELMDHLCCEIEQEMTDNDTPFESAASIVFERWQAELQVKKSWLIGLKNNFPEFVVKNLFRKVVFHFSFIILTLVLTGIYAITKSDFAESESIISYFNCAVIFFGIIYFIMNRKINQSKLKTTYSFQFFYFYFPLMLLLIHLLIVDSNEITTFLLLFSFLNLPFACYFYFKHFQTLKKFKYEN